MTTHLMEHRRNALRVLIALGLVLMISLGTATAPAQAASAAGGIDCPFATEAAYLRVPRTDEASVFAYRINSGQWQFTDIFYAGNAGTWRLTDEGWVGDSDIISILAGGRRLVEAYEARFNFSTGTWTPWLPVGNCVTSTVTGGIVFS